MFPWLDLYHDPAQHLRTASLDLDDLDRDASDLSDVCNPCTSLKTNHFIIIIFFLILRRMGKNKA